MSIKYRKDMYDGEEGHPQCCFFEAFPSSLDPHEDYYGFFACHMSLDEDHAEICKGDYLKCPISKGRLSSLTTRSTDRATAPEKPRELDKSGYYKDVLQA